MAELGSLYPNIVRIEASDLVRHEAITLLVETLHSFGAKLLVRDIETPAQFAVAVQANADYLQGNLLGEPAHAIEVIDRLPAFETINR
jgi:EAL domain-containing protein (putative c-di-GMP-specific phosphodiesterase class I)